MTSLPSLLHKLICSPVSQHCLPILKAILNAFVYGIKVRFPHALIMAVLFGRGDWRSRAKHICRSCIEHSAVLAKAAGGYKLAMLIQRNTIKGKERSFETFIAGFFGGYVAFNNQSAVCEQIALYVASRAIAGFIPRAPDSVATTSTSSGPFKPSQPDSRYMQALMALSWSTTMWLFRHHAERLQPGLLSSIRYIYLE
ncbi:peroxisomal protein [Coprinopsis sp. MPI-PUGE-AT-0042]|nr:peroxisomal protein [Coprinopsis sp. MPI-PUGE-AT-0042]